MKPRRKPFLRGASVVWLVPVVALGTALWVGYRSLAERGPLIHISFDNASGVSAGETELRFRDVAVGLVEEVGFSESLDHVVVSVRLEPDVAPYVDESAQFWVVRPEVTTRGVTGLDTVLSGVFIQGQWDGDPNGLERDQDGLASAPLGELGRDGLRLTLRSNREDGFTENTPILFKGIEVGRIGPAQITQDGSAVFSDAIIFAPHDRLVTTATRFWDTSGFRFSLGPNGAEIDFNSIASLVAGGITFDTLVSGGDPVRDGLTFFVYPDEPTARNSVFDNPDGRTVSLSVVFDENVAGLSSGANVELGGIRVGRVANVGGYIDADRFGDRRARLQAVLDIQIGRLGLGDRPSTRDALDYLADRVQNGLRARLANASILTGGLKVELAEVDDATPAQLDLDADPYPQLPTAPGDIRDVSATAEGVFDRINALPVEELLDSAVTFLDTATALVGNDDIQATPGDLRALLGDMRGVVASDEVQNLPGDVSGLVAELQATVVDLRATIAQVNEAQAVERIVAAVERAEETLAETTEGVPSLLTEFEGLAADARALPLEALITRATMALNTVEGFVASEGTQALPADVSAALADLRGLVNDTRGLVTSPQVQEVPGAVTALLDELQGTVAELRSTVAQVNEAQGVERLLTAIDAVDLAAEDVSTSIEGVPALVAELESVAASANELPLEELTNRASALLATADSVLGSEATRALPTELNAALADLRRLLNQTTDFVASDELQAIPGDVSALLAELQGTVGDLRGVVAEVQAAGLATRLTETLEAAEATARDISGATAGVPDLIAELQGVAAEARNLPLTDLVARTTDLIDKFNELAGSEETGRLPERLNGVLSEVEATLTELRDGGAINNVNSALTSAEAAARAIEDGAASVPGLISQINTLLAQAGTTLGGYSETSETNRQIRAALNDVQRAAEAVTSLARAIERRPNSIILGR